MQRILSFFFLFTCYISGLNAESDTIRNQSIAEVKVITSIKPSVSQAGSPLQVMTSDDMERVGVTSIPDAVRRFAGIAVKDYGGIGGLKTVSIRGLGAQHTGVSYDGIPVGEAQSGQIDIGRFTLDNVSLLTFNIGQSDDIFQSARHFASSGFLNIVTTQPVFSDSKKYNGYAKIKTGSFGIFEPTLYYAHRLTSDWSASVNGSWQRADGNYPYEFSTGPNKTEKDKRYNSDVDIWRTELSIYGNLHNAGLLRIKTSYFDSERGLPVNVISVNTDSRQRLWNKAFFAQANYENELSNKFSIQGLGKFARNYDRYIDRSLNYDDGVMTERYTQLEYYGSATVLYKPVDVLSFSLAQDYVHNRLHMNFPLTGSSGVEEGLDDESITNKAHRHTSLTAFNAQFKTKRITITGSLLATYVEEYAEKGDIPDDKKRLSPAINVSYKLFDGEGIRLRASYKDVYRVPTFNDLYYSRIGTSELRPEISKQHNVGLTWATSFVGALNYLNASVDVYLNKVKDKIVLHSPAPFVWKMKNRDNVTIKGIDVAVAAEKDLNKEMTLFLNATYGYQYAKDDDLKREIPYVPNHVGSFSVSYENPWINISYSLVCSDKTYSEYEHLQQNLLDSYFDHSVSINKTINVWANKLRMQADFLNLSDKNYEVMKGYPMPGRSFRVTGTFIF